MLAEKNFGYTGDKSKTLLPEIEHYKKTEMFNLALARDYNDDFFSSSTGCISIFEPQTVYATEGSARDLR